MTLKRMMVGKGNLMLVRTLLLGRLVLGLYLLTRPGPPPNKIFHNLLGCLLVALV